MKSALFNEVFKALSNKVGDAVLVNNFKPLLILFAKAWGTDTSQAPPRTLFKFNKTSYINRLVQTFKKLCMFSKKYTSQKIHVAVYLGIQLHCILKANMKKLEDVPIQLNICRAALNKQKIPRGYRTVKHVLYDLFAIETLYGYYVPSKKNLLVNSLT